MPNNVHDPLSNSFHHGVSHSCLVSHYKESCTKLTYVNTGGIQASPTN